MFHCHGRACLCLLTCMIEKVVTCRVSLSVQGLGVQLSFGTAAASKVLGRYAAHLFCYSVTFGSFV